MLHEAYYKEKDYIETLRNVGIKTRMRVRNKGHVKQLLLFMLEYVESGKIPESILAKHEALMGKEEHEID